MRKTILFIAMSLDGYIAGKDGNVDWLQGQNPGEDDMAGYHEFVREIDTVIMGWNTYHQIVTELSPEKWIYDEFMTYVCTHRSELPKKNIQFVDRDVCDLIRELKKQEGKAIWICGGAAVIQPLVRADLIDRFHISIIPAVMGDGIRLFEAMDKQIRLKLTDSRSYNGITDVIYEYREQQSGRR